MQLLSTWDATGHDGVEGCKVHVDVERHAVVGHPALRPHADGRNLAAVDPHSREPPHTLPIQARHRC
jgi:hypothetical protein